MVNRVAVPKPPEVGIFGGGIQKYIVWILENHPPFIWRYWRHRPASEVCRSLGLTKNSSERLESMRKSAREACSRRTPRFGPILMNEFNLPRYISTSPVSMKRNLSISQVVQSVGMDGFARHKKLKIFMTDSISPTRDRMSLYRASRSAKGNFSFCLWGDRVPRTISNRWWGLWCVEEI